MPWCVLRELPLIPDELQFRFVEHDLVLIDIDASLVVDVLPNALPARATWKGLSHADIRGGKSSYVVFLHYVERRYQTSSRPSA